VNEYRFADVHVGLSHRFKTMFTKEDIDRFAALSGDANPLHTEPDFAQQVGWQDQVVHGMLTASVFSRLVGMLLPGKFALLHEVDAKFKRPVFPGMELEVAGSVTYVNEAYQQMEIKATVDHAGAGVVATAKLKVGFSDG
jgi:3-hydroxybutyryl-CoA dehydratase